MNKNYCVVLLTAESYNYAKVAFCQEASLQERIRTMQTYHAKSVYSLGEIRNLSKNEAKSITETLLDKFERVKSSTQFLKMTPLLREFINNEKGLPSQSWRDWRDMRLCILAWNTEPENETITF